MVRTIALIPLACAAALHAGQGLILEQSTEDMRSGKKTSSTSYIEQNRVAVEANSDGRQMTMVFLADDNTIRMIDHDKKTVQEISGDDIEKMMSQLNEAKAKMEAQMKNMPPQQRAMMEKMMSGRMQQMMGGVSEKPTYKRGDGSAEIGGRSCDWYEGYRGEKMFSMVCAADWSSFELRASDFAVFTKMTEFLAQLAPNVADTARVGAEDWQERQSFPGVPLEQTIFSNGKPKSKSTFERMERGAIDDSLFAVPDGYRVRKGMPGGRR